jgi:hypothetical protein
MPSTEAAIRLEETSMYATLSYDVSAGQAPIEAVRKMIVEVFKNRATCDLLSDTFICEVENTADYLAVVRKLRKVGNDLGGQFQFVFTLHAAGAPLRSNASFPKSKANDIIDPGDDE